MNDDLLKSPESKRRFLALWFPFLPLDRLRIARPDLWEASSAPTAIVEKVRGAMRLCALDSDVLGLGLAPAMPLADARAQIPELRVFDAEPHADQDWLERLCDGAARYTPMAAVDPPAAHAPGPQAMSIHWAATHMLHLIVTVGSREDLGGVMALVTARLGFEHFALVHHGDLLSENGGDIIHLHDYPARWADFYAANSLGISDPVHRASHVTSVGFRWAHLAEMIPLTAQDRRILSLGKAQGIGDGYTVPAHVPGESRGSCSFANSRRRAVPHDRLMLAQLAGTYAFDAARRLWSGHIPNPQSPVMRLTDRQRDCVLWAARGKSDWEIGRILDISEETVRRHIKHACARYRVNKRILLVGRTLLDGTLTITDITGRGYTPFWA